MKQITIKIECKETTCGECSFLGHINYPEFPEEDCSVCSCYRKELKATSDNNFKRLQECIEAEGK